MTECKFKDILEKIDNLSLEELDALQEEAKEMEKDYKVNQKFQEDCLLRTFQALSKDKS